MRPHEVGFYGGIVFIFGVVSAHLSHSVCIAFICSCFLIVCFYFGKGIWWGVLAGCIFFSAFFYTHFYNFWTTTYLSSSQETIVIDAMVTDAPSSAVDGQKFMVSLQEKPYKGKVQVYSDLYPRVQGGDMVKITGKFIIAPEETGWIQAYKVVIQERRTSLLSALFSLRTIAQEKIDKVLPPHAAALLCGILFGERASFSKSLSQYMLYYMNENQKETCPQGLYNSRCSLE